jgi:hypothetical protein
MNKSDVFRPVICFLKLSKQINLCAILFLGMAADAYSQIGYLDNTFNSTGFNLTVSVDYPILIPTDMLIQPDQ